MRLNPWLWWLSERPWGQYIIRRIWSLAHRIWYFLEDYRHP